MMCKYHVIELCDFVHLCICVVIAVMFFVLWPVRVTDIAPQFFETNEGNVDDVSIGNKETPLCTCVRKAFVRHFALSFSKVPVRFSNISIKLVTISMDI